MWKKKQSSLRLQHSHSFAGYKNTAITPLQWKNKELEEEAAAAVCTLGLPDISKHKYIIV
jgi:hypothetical protein